MRLQQLSASIPRLRVPMKLHEKMGQVQDDQSITSDDDENDFYSTIAPAVESEMGVKAARNFEIVKNTSNRQMMPSSSSIMPTMTAKNTEQCTGRRLPPENGEIMLPVAKDKLVGGGISKRENSCSQMNKKCMKKYRRTMWNCYGIANKCLLVWMLMSCCLIECGAITRNGEFGVKASSDLSTSLEESNAKSHTLSERSASAIVKLEPDYQPIIFPDKEENIEENHLQSKFNKDYEVAEKDDVLDDKNREEITNPTEIPEASRSQIIFRGIRNRTRVEVGPVSLFATKRKGFADTNDEDSLQTHRRGRVMFPKSEALNERENNSTLPSSSRTTKSEALLSTLAQSSEEGSSRKASPDVQDIIDGIVKLLGGKVHHPQPMPQVPFTQRQPQSTAYNLFNPNKPIYYPTAKPNRINSRGPPLIGPQNSTPQQQQQQSQSSFEAIPLEALNSEFKLNQTRFGPPFPLSQVVVPPEAPYKQGVPVPEQLVPPPNSNGNINGNFNLRPPLPTPTAPSSYVTGGNGNVNNFSHDIRQHNSFYNNGNNGYNGNAISSGNQQRPSSSAAPSLASPSSAAPNHNGATGLTTVSTTLKTSNKNHNAHDNFNENGTRNPYGITSNLHDDNSRRPTTTYATSDGSVGNTALTTVASLDGQDKNNYHNNHHALSSPRPPPLSLTLPTGPEDDEEDDLRFTTNVDFDLGSQNNGVKWNESPAPSLLGNKRPTPPPVSLEPTISDDSQLPSWSNTGSGRIGSNKETVFEFSELGPSSQGNGFIRPTSVNTLYPTLVLETNSENGLVEIVTKLAAPVNEEAPQILPVPTTTQDLLSTATTSISQPHPESNLRKQVQHFNNLHSTRQTPASTDNTGLTTSSIHSLPTPPLRKGIVINDGPPGNDGKGYGSVEVVTVDEAAAAAAANAGSVGEIFDVTVTAKQSFGGKVSGQAFAVADPKDDLVITHPTGTEQYVSIDGKRTYFNLHPNTPTAIGAGGATKAVGHVLPVENTDVVSVEVGKHPGSKPTATKPQPSQNIGVGTVGNPVPLLPQPPGKTLFGISSGSGNTPSRAVSTSLSISGSSGGMTGPSGASGGKSPPTLIRRPHARRPSVPPVRIDTCIVGDDSTCNSEQGEVCRTESGVSSCVCRSGYARRRHREPCKAIVSLVMSIKLDKLGDKKLTYNPDYFNPNSEMYQTLEWETIHAMDSALGETTLSSGYVGSKLEAIGFDGRHAVVNTTVLIQENAKQSASQVKRDLQKQMIQVLTRNRNNFGKSQLWVEGPISAVAAITDLDECESPEMNDCDSKAKCVNTLGSFECKCEPGYGDPFEKDKRRSGRKCESCNGKTYCNGRGECLVENGQKVCRCAGNYYGSQCDIDGEVLAVAIGASVSAVVIIGLTLACLCMWSRKWKREEQKAAMMSRTLFGGMATQALSYLGGKNNSNPYQQHLSMDDRLRWAQVSEANMGGNIYVQNEPMSMHTSPQLMGSSMMETPPMMSARRSAETVDTTVDDLFDERQTKRPRSRASQVEFIQGSLYYDLEPEPKSDIYASRSMVQFPAQFCVPMSSMSHYAPPNRGYYP